MIRPSIKSDYRRMKVNRFSDISDLNFAFDDEEYYKFTLVDGDEVIAMILFRRYWGNNFFAFFLISENIKPVNARELKNFVWKSIIDLDADRVQTDSVKCDLLTKWHKFLGFTLEGTSEKMMHGQDYCRWAVVKGREYNGI